MIGLLNTLTETAKGDHLALSMAWARIGEGDAVPVTEKNALILMALDISEILKLRAKMLSRLVASLPVEPPSDPTADPHALN